MTTTTTTPAARIAAAFARAREERRTALIPYVMAGYPDEATSEALALALAQSGADVLEMGVPFSDPLADGATIQHASHQALQNGMSLAGALALAGRVASRTTTPLVLMTYYNPIFQFGRAGGEQRFTTEETEETEERPEGGQRGTAEGAEGAERLITEGTEVQGDGIQSRDAHALSRTSIPSLRVSGTESGGVPASSPSSLPSVSSVVKSPSSRRVEGALVRFARAAREAGIAGVIVPDLPPEEAEPLRDALADRDLALIFLVTPTSPDARVERVARMAETSGGFIYCVSLSGVTGARDRLPEQLSTFVGRVRERATLPLAVGFGVARAEHVAEIGRIADGAVVASALLNAADAATPERRVEAAVAFLRELSHGAGQ